MNGRQMVECLGLLSCLLACAIMIAIFVRHKLDKCSSMELRAAYLYPHKAIERIRFHGIAIPIPAKVLPPLLTFYSEWTGRDFL